MNKKKVERKFRTFAFNEVFSSDRVYVDVNNNVLYDTVTGVAIAYIKITHTHMYIIFVFPDFVDDDFKKDEIPLAVYFNKDNVVVKDFSKFYFRVANGYYYLGHPCKDTKFQIRLPRLFDPDGDTNESEMGSAGDSEFDDYEDLEEFDFDDFEQNEFEDDLDEIIKKLIE